jgi:hypothetical protein
VIGLGPEIDDAIMARRLGRNGTVEPGPSASVDLCAEAAANLKVISWSEFTRLDHRAARPVTQPPGGGEARRQPRPKVLLRALEPGRPPALSAAASAWAMKGLERLARPWSRTRPRRMRRSSSPVTVLPRREVQSRLKLLGFFQNPGCRAIAHIAPSH